jgi:hypothetical protein
VLLYSPRTEADTGLKCRPVRTQTGNPHSGANRRYRRSNRDGIYGRPERLYVIAPGGGIAYESEPGPFRFKPEIMERYLRKALGETPQSGISPVG